MLQPSENLKFVYKNEEKILLYFLDLQAFASSKLVCVFTQSCPILCNPMGCGLSGSFVHGIFQAKILDQVVISFSRGSSQPRNLIGFSYVSSIGRRVLYHLCHLGRPSFS